MEDKATVDFLVDAKLGDTVWHFDGHRNHYVDGKYQDRGVWALSPISAETRKSFTVQHGKFDRKLGFPMGTGGYTVPHKIRGQKEYEALIWLDRNRRKIMDAVENCRDIDKLKQIAEIVGYVE